MSPAQFRPAQLPPANFRAANFRPVLPRSLRHTLLGAAALLLPVSAVSAQSVPESVEELPAVVVSATGTPTPAQQVASSVTVVTAEEIERLQRRTLPDVLQLVPGLNVVQTGGPGGPTSIFMRGTNSNQVKVLIDGIDASDPSSPSGAFDFGNILTYDIARIEVLRGPQSGLYGADAIGGVISITTKRGEGPAKVSAQAEGGSFGTFNQMASLSGSTGNVGYSFNAAHFRSTDTPVTPPDLVPPGYPTNPNAYYNWTLSGRIDADVSDNFSVNFITRYLDAQLEFTPDVFPPPFYAGIPAAERSIADSRSLFMRGEGVWTANERLTSWFGVGYIDYDRPTTGPNLDVNGTFDGERTTYYWRSTLDIMEGQKLTAGIERRNDSMTSETLYSELDADTGNTGVYAQLQSSFGERFFLASNLRYDEDDDFGSHLTWRLAPAILFPETGTKLKASYGTGFKAPSLFQLYAPFYGNPDLRPEESEGWDIGFEQQILSGRASFGATWFHNDIDNLISYDPVTFANVNIASARTQGVEAFFAVQVNAALGVRVDYTYTDVVGYTPEGTSFGAACAPINATSCTPLRRPENKVSLTVDWQATEALTLSGTVVHLSSWEDITRLTSEYVDQPGYTLVNLAAEYQVSPAFQLYGRVDNLFDEQYENPNGFLAPGLGAFGGVKVTF